MGKSIYQVDYAVKKDGMFQVNAENEEEAIAKVEEKLEGEGEIVEIEAHKIYDGNH